MIIFAKANGEVIETKPTPFYQGSSLKGSIYLVAPFPNTNGVTIQFQLPNGNVTKAYPMTPTGEVEGVMLDGYELSAWTWDVKNAMVTAIPGVVTATITVYNGEPNITYYGYYATLEKITAIENPQTNAYAYCRADGKIYKYDGENWTKSDIAISANDYVKMTIVSSFSIIKGTPNALDPSTPSASEWQAIISALNAIGGKVAKPLMTNFEYDPLTGESVKSYNNGMVQTVEFPKALPEGYYSEEYQSFTKTTFKSESWVDSDMGNYSHMLVIENPTIKLSEDFGFEVAVFRLISKTLNTFEKMDPFIVVNFNNSHVKIYSNITYIGYALFFWKGSFVEQNYLPSIEKAKLDAEVATSQAEIATERANSISQTLEDAYENGEFGIPSGGTAGQILTKTESGTAWKDAPSGGGGASFSYYSLKPYSDYLSSGVLGVVPNLGGISKIEIDSYIIEANIFTGSETNEFLEVYDASIGSSAIIYENGTKNNIDFTINYTSASMYWDIGEKINLPYNINNGGYDFYNIHEIILKIYPKEA